MSIAQRVASPPKPIKSPELTRKQFEELVSSESFIGQQEELGMCSEEIAEKAPIFYDKQESVKRDYTFAACQRIDHARFLLSNPCQLALYSLREDNGDLHKTRAHLLEMLDPDYICEDNLIFIKT